MSTPALAGLAALALHASPARAEDTVGADLVGSWRFDVVVTTRAQVPILGEAVVETHKVMLATVRRDPAGALRQSHVACGMYARSNRRVAETWFPPSFVAAMHEQEYGLQVRAEAAGEHVSATVSPVHLGWDPGQSGGVMPRQADAPGVVDGDRDGQPGVTVHVRAPLFGQVSVYVVQHSVTALDGWRHDPDTIRGSARLARLEQRALGASNPLFATNVPLAPDDDRSWFSMRRVPEGTTCLDLDRVEAPEAGTPASERAGAPTSR
ncbi:hypothetical protein L6R53_13825 [Myxococcota bacterium]|nr:hypothetical protein [Myxococcota bacterium]